MAKKAKRRVRALVALDYPTKAATLNTVLKAGGLHKMTPDEREEIADDYAHAEPGDIVLGLLPCHLEHWLEIGAIEEVAPAAKPKKKAKGK